jgi:hypothetical protein
MASSEVALLLCHCKILLDWLGIIFNIYRVLALARSFGPLAPNGAVILQAKARRLRLVTDNQSLYSKFDEYSVSWRTLIIRYLLRPFIMLIQKPILVLSALYISLVYCIIC